MNKNNFNILLTLVYWFTVYLFNTSKLPKYPLKSSSIKFPFSFCEENIIIKNIFTFTQKIILFYLELYIRVEFSFQIEKIKVIIKKYLIEGC